MTAVEMPVMSEHRENGRAEVSPGLVRTAAGASFVGVLAATALPGLGLAVAAGAALVATGLVVRHQPVTSGWCLATVSLLPWLILRANSWLALTIIASVVMVVMLGMMSGATGQSIGDLALGRVVRLRTRRFASPGGSSLDASAGGTGMSNTSQSVIVGLAIALPIVVIFHQLLASADAVFKSWIDPSVLPLLRVAALLVVTPVALLLARFGSHGASLPGSPGKTRFGVLESSIVLGAVSLLFAAFIAARISTLGQPLENVALRGEVREGFFQLLWVAALTVVLVLMLRAAGGTNHLHVRVRRLGRLVIGLAAIIDVLALVRIVEYIEQTFHTPLRFWSFSFGVWLLVVLALTGLRLGEFRSHQRWFTAALVSSWLVFVFIIGLVNPDQRIAQHNFDNASTTQVEWIAVNNLITLSEDATPAIVSNVDVLRPMPNTRFERMVSHLCELELSGHLREFNVSRRRALVVTAGLCARE